LYGYGTAPHHTGFGFFTPTHEVPSAGHPNVGTAYVLAADAANSTWMAKLKCLNHSVSAPMGGDNVAEADNGGSSDYAEQ